METLDLRSHLFTFIVISVAVLAVLTVYVFPLITFSKWEWLVGKNRLLMPHIISLLACSMWWYCSHLKRMFVEETMYGAGAFFNITYIMLYTIPIIKANKVATAIIIGLIFATVVVIFKEAYSLKIHQYAALQWFALVSEIVASATPLIYNMCTTFESHEVEQHISSTHSIVMTICGLIGFVAGAFGKHIRIVFTSGLNLIFGVIQLIWVHVATKHSRQQNLEIEITT